MSSVRDALVQKRSWSKQQLSARVQQLRKITPMSLATAHAVLAHQNGIKIDRFLDNDALKHVGDVLTKLNTAVTPTARNSGNHTRGSRSSHQITVRSPRNIVFSSKCVISDPLLSAEKIREARDMAAVYPILYVLENSMREVVDRVMKAKFGADWWDTALTSGKLKNLKEKSDSRRKKEDLMSWHQRRGARPIDYIDIGELGDIINGKQDLFFPDVLGSTREWFEQFMRELEPSRNVLAHMNPLSTTNVDDLRVKAERWTTLVNKQKDKIPT